MERLTDFGTLFQREPDATRFSVDLLLTSYRETRRVRSGLLAPEAVRTVRLPGVVGTGATRLVLPADVVSSLGVPVVGKIACRDADGRTVERAVVGDVHLEIQGRSSVFTAVVAPGRKDALVGDFVLQELDFVVDPVDKRLVPRDPRGIVAEIEAVGAC